jgi:GNAT superfamily N-acetyltransferase
MNISDVTRRIVDQRRQRYSDVVPGLAPGGVAHCRLDGLQLRVAFATAGPGRAESLVTGVLRYCALRGLGIYWTVMPARPGEAELPAALLAHAFQREETQRLLAHQGPVAVPCNPRVTIHPIVTWQAMLLYELGSRTAFFDDPHPVPALAEHRARQRLQEQDYGWCRYYAGHLDGRPAGGCYVTLYDDVPTIMGVYTVPAAQRQGVATALVAAAVGELVASRRDVCCLYVHHGNAAERLYQRLGFEPLLDELAFAWKSGAYG